ncbi:MAG: 1-acyl-sn-glycerol-3-phosphate acyltransferase [Pseudomonadota bacterium]
MRDFDADKFEMSSTTEAGNTNIQDTGVKQLRLNGESSSKPKPFRGPFSELWRWICYLFMKIAGWRFVGDWPADVPKAVLVAAPHTSNWDGIYMLASAGYYRTPLQWMGKKELTEGPFGGFVKWLGCVPIDRSGNNDMVSQMADAFRASDEMILAVPPEGTRAKTRKWKSGFYYIAATADVPLILTVLDFGSKTVRVAGTFKPMGDFDQDLPKIKEVYNGARGKFDEKYTKPG